VLLRLAYLGVTNALALLRLLPMSDRDKDAEILALRHQITVLERQLGGERVRFTRIDRAWLTALLHPLPRTVLHQLRLVVRPETVLRWHRDLIARRHASSSRPCQRFLKFGSDPLFVIGIDPLKREGFACAAGRGWRGRTSGA
jgi:putative transposase